MFRVGDRVMYGIQGVCEIVEVASQKIGQNLVECYVLVPVDQPASRYFIPLQNKLAVSKLRPMISREKLEALVHSPNALADAWIEDEKQRKQAYRELISSGDCVALLRMVHGLLLYKSQQEASGKRLHISDENFLRDAQRLLSVEFSQVLGTSRDSAIDYITNALKNANK